MHGLGIGSGRPMIIDAGRFDVGTAYAAVNRIRCGDQRPYFYRTHDHGDARPRPGHSARQRGVGTHGRSFWILDDISPLRQFNAVPCT